jgi:hypothetical protein
MPGQSRRGATVETSWSHGEPAAASTDQLARLVSQPAPRTGKWGGTDGRLSRDLPHRETLRLAASLESSVAPAVCRPNAHCFSTLLGIHVTAT